MQSNSSILNKQNYTTEFAECQQKTFHTALFYPKRGKLRGYPQKIRPEGGFFVYITLLMQEIRMSPATTRSSAAKPDAKLSE